MRTVRTVILGALMSVLGLSASDLDQLKQEGIV